MDQLDLAIVRCKVSLIRDEETPGDGNCFTRSIMQQCERKEIKEWIREHQPWKMANSHHDLRIRVSKFALQESNDNLRNLREHYENIQVPLQIEDGNEVRSWNDYWIWMSQDKVWADDIFIQATAWYLELDLKIITYTSTPEKPFMTITGGEYSRELNKPNLYLGYYPVPPNQHYQSFLPKLPVPSKSLPTLKLRRKKHDENGSFTSTIDKEREANKWKEVTSKNVSTKKVTSNPNSAGDIKMQQNEQKILSRVKIELEAEEARKERANEWKRKNTLQTSICATKNPTTIPNKRVKKENVISDEERKRRQNEWKRKSRAKKKAENENSAKIDLEADKAKEELKRKENEWKRKSDAKLRQERGEKEVKKQQTERKLKSNSKLRLERGAETLKESAMIQKRLSRFRQKELNPQKLKDDEHRWHQQRKQTEEKRLNKFLRSTLYSAIFPCISCQRLLFESNVCKVESKLIVQIETKKKGLFKSAVEMFKSEPLRVNINGDMSSYICLTCKSHLIAGKLPPMSTCNGLKIYDHEPDLELTELEGNLIAKNILFMKIFQMPRSRWTALKDRIVNVPVNDDDIINTVTQLPRTPAEAGLIEVDLKRKKEYKTSHVKQLIDPKKCYKMLEVLKKSKNMYYQFYDDYNTYTTRCRNEDSNGYSLIFEEEVELMKDITGANDSEEKSVQEILETEYVEKDPVKRYHFSGYDKSLCMSNMYPEMDPENSVIVAPGEGKVPKNILYDHDWDIKAFPHLNSPDGKYGLHHDRSRKLTDQYYFIQRILNRKNKFAKCPSYVYAAVAYNELKQIQRNINVSYSRGKEIIDEQGNVKLKMEDAYSVLDDIKQSPRYWRKKKYEMYSKLDNFGPFQFFFTFSCPDLRGDENFGAILRERGCIVRHEIEVDEEGYPTTSVYIDYEKNGEKLTKRVKDYIKEDLDESLHECIRGNVLMATRYFNHRVKSFINNIVLGKGNPMMVDKFTYKTEFQSRGAPHVHGTLWVKLHEVEKLRKLKSGKLLTKKEYHKLKKNEEFTLPFVGISQTFEKLRNEQDLEPNEKKSLINFIDEYTTVSLCKDEVGKKVVQIAKEVNRHSHSKTCRKRSTTCRFNYPKFPIWTTIVAIPYPDTEFEEERVQNLKYYSETLSKVHEILDKEEIIEAIMADYDKPNESKEEYEVNRKKRILRLLEAADVSEEDYLTALSYNRFGHSYHIKRDIDEIHINSYNTEWLRAWDGNLDIQVCMDFFQVITYVTAYYNKDENELENVIKQVVESNPDESVKEKMRKIATVFLTHRQIGESESFYKLLPDLLLTNSNVTCQWLFLGRKEERYKRMKRADEKDESNPNLVTLDGIDGKWFEQPDMLSKYKRRPDSLEDMCYCQFGKMYRSGGKFGNDGEEKEEEVEQQCSEDDDEDDSGEEYDPEVEFSYIMTEDRGRGPKLPHMIKLKTSFPKENPMMQKRSRPVAIRFHKVNKKNSPYKYFLSEMMLYLPFRDEEEEFKPDDEDFITDFYFENEERIKSIKKKVMKYLESVEEARHHVEEATKKLDLEQIAVKLDAAKEQEDAECEESGDEMHPDYEYLDVENVEIVEKSQSKDVPLYSRVNIPDYSELKAKTRGMDENQRQVVDIAVTFAKDLIKAEDGKNPVPQPLMLMVGGGAGVGKTHVINTVAEWVQHILQKPGDTLNCPYVLKTAFTGTAASLIEGMTLHSAFGFDFGNKHYSMSDKTRDAKRDQLKKLKLVLVDEISMLKSDLFYQMDLRFQEITGRIGVPFGGISIILFGDILQLRPVMGKFIFEAPQNSLYRVTDALDPRWKMMKVMNLTKNHRQGKFHDYANLLNRVRTGSQTREDLKMLEERVRPVNHPDLKSVNLFIVCTKKVCGRINSFYLQQLEGRELVIRARHHLQTRKKFKPYICAKEGTVANTSFMDELHLKIGCKVILIHNIDTSDGLTNGQLGELRWVIKNEDGNIVKLLVEFKNEKVGSKNRKNNSNLIYKYPKATVIEKVCVSYSLSKKSSVDSVRPTLIQFPIKVAQAITAHKIQGQSILMPSKVALDLSSVFEAAQAYVMLSRVENIEQIYILNRLKEEKIRPDQKALLELEDMNKRSINENPIPWNDQDGSSVRIAHLNSMNLTNNFEDIRCDPNLMKSSVLTLSETWLTTSNGPEIESFKSHFNSVGLGKGLALYYKQEMFQHIEDITEENMQLTKLWSLRVDVIVVYRSDKGSPNLLLEHLKKLISPNKTTAICGDFNICYLQTRRNKITKYLEETGFEQFVNEATFIKGSLLDHFYLRRNEAMDGSVFRYSPYYSDHDAICATISIRK